MGWAGRSTPPPSNTYYALYARPRAFLSEGSEKVFARTKEAHKMLVKELGEMGLPLIVAAPYRPPQVNVVTIPDGEKDAKEYNLSPSCALPWCGQRLLSEYAIEIGAGPGDPTGEVRRIGLMGQDAGRENVTKLVHALNAILKTRFPARPG